MIFPQTSHFDDLQKQKGKRLPCGVFPFERFLFYYFIILRSQTSDPMPAGESVFA